LDRTNATKVRVLARKILEQRGYMMKVRLYMLSICTFLTRNAASSKWSGQFYLFLFTMLVFFRNMHYNALTWRRRPSMYSTGR
jgi:hypothetical protein